MSIFSKPFEDKKVARARGFTTYTQFQQHTCSTDTTSEMSEGEEQIAELHRNATKHKDAKDWDKAIGCLRAATNLTSNVATSYPIAHYLRLPLFLQQAGLFDEAMQEFEKLLAGVESSVGKEFSHQPAQTQKMLCQARYAAIYDKMRLACQRSGFKEKAAEYETLAEKYKEDHLRLQKVDNARLEAKFKKRKG